VWFSGHSFLTRNWFRSILPASCSRDASYILLRGAKVANPAGGIYLKHEADFKAGPARRNRWQASCHVGMVKRFNSTIKAIAEIGVGLITGLISGGISGAVIGLILGFLAPGALVFVLALFTLMGTAIGACVGLVIGIVTDTIDRRIGTSPEWAVIAGLGAGLGAGIWDYRFATIVTAVVIGAITGALVAHRMSALFGKNAESRVTIRTLASYALGFLLVTGSVYKTLELLTSAIAPLID
jgi:hypothetical protein